MVEQATADGLYDLLWSRTSSQKILMIEETAGSFSNLFHGRE